MLMAASLEWKKIARIIVVRARTDSYWELGAPTRDTAVVDDIFQYRKY